MVVLYLAFLYINDKLINLINASELSHSFRVYA